MTRYLSCAETAKLVRGALKKAFPSIKFSVRSSVYSGGASIRVGWMDGPVESEVKSVVSPYGGAGFDGMIDMKFNYTAYLMPDGSATIAGSPGTTGSMGIYEPIHNMKPHPDAERVHFGADYIFCDRNYSVGMVTRALNKVCRYWGVTPEGVTVKVWDHDGSAHVDGAGRVKIENASEYLDVLVHRELVRRTNYLRAA